MPCAKPKPGPKRDPNDPVERFKQVRDAAILMINQLEHDDGSIDDSDIVQTYFNLEQRMQSNCDSVAQGLMVVMASICAARRHLTNKLFPSAIEPVYALGFERFEDFSAYLVNLAHLSSPYLGPPTPSGREYLIELSASEVLIREAVATVWHSMRRDPPESDEYVPAILKLSQSEQGAAGQPATTPRVGA